MISIVVPVLNEEKTIESTLLQLTSLDGDKEIIVADGGSSDRTVEIAGAYAKVVVSEKGRGMQLNAGAKATVGDVLWFVHSDSRVNEGSLSAIQSAISSGHRLGCFSLYFFDRDTAFMRWLASSSNRRAKFLGLSYGDQGIFVERKLFSELGGFKEICLMEDWDFSIRARKKTKLKLLKTNIGTSARRFTNGGCLKTLLKMHKIKLLYALGTDPEELMRIYREER